MRWTEIGGIECKVGEETGEDEEKEGAVEVEVEVEVEVATDELRVCCGGRGLVRT